MTCRQKATVVAVGALLAAAGVLVSAVSAIVYAIEQGARDAP